MNKPFDVTSYLKFQKKTSSFYNIIMLRACEEVGISKPEADILCFLANNPDLNTGIEISMYRGLSKAYVSKAVDLLVRKNLIISSTNSSDRRSQYLSLTEDAAVFISPLLFAQKKFWDTVFLGIDEKEKQMLADITTKVTANIDGSK